MQWASYCPKEKAAHLGLDTIGTKGEWQWLWTWVLHVRMRHWKGTREEKQWQSTSLSLVGSTLWWTTDLLSPLDDLRMEDVKRLVERPVDLGQTGDPACGKSQPERFGATSSQRCICLQRRLVFFCQSDLDALGKKHLNPKSHYYSLTRLNF